MQVSDPNLWGRGGYVGGVPARGWGAGEVRFVRRRETRSNFKHLGAEDGGAGGEEATEQRRQSRVAATK